MLNDESMHKRLKQSDLACASSSATHNSILAELNTRLEETNSRIEAATLATRVWESRIDLYANSRFRCFPLH